MGENYNSDHPNLFCAKLASPLLQPFSNGEKKNIASTAATRVPSQPHTKICLRRNHHAQVLLPLWYPRSSKISPSWRVHVILHVWIQNKQPVIWHSLYVFMLNRHSQSSYIYIIIYIYLSIYINISHRTGFGQGPCSARHRNQDQHRPQPQPVTRCYYPKSFACTLWLFNIAMV